MREESLIKRVESLINGYNFVQPFALYLRDHFRKNPNMGSTDRRMTRSWCYNYFRLGKALTGKPFRERLAIACFLCNQKSNQYTEYLAKEFSFLMKVSELTLSEKMELIINHYPAFENIDLFPMHDELSEKINQPGWYLSFLSKPLVWIRIRKMHREKVINELKELSIHYNKSDYPDIYSFEPNVQLEKTHAFEKGFFEIQDYSSQMTGEFFQASDGEKWWDACCGSGGKSLMLMEQGNDIHILATDVRPAILYSYAERMKKADYYTFQTQEFDFDPPGKKRSINLPKFDGIIADVPCSGSGTWARSPEWNQIDLTEKIKSHYVPLQRKIVMEAMESLKPGRPLIYITCSVFKKENEENISYFTDQLPLTLEKMRYLEGFRIGADTLFAARLIRK
jgi:16S rRNA (cytosine967-C5)-methyltransferase